ncbi:ferredoxin--NADP(+) reductase [Halovibrio salipaludis]|uniref:Ferredoxin--NADP(+) reductase n=1 Tax=Halovibrio salipaludis TaxID=2032626 RepID=A0A2A2F7B3_9GAMM|nr:PDR/VanB family oxidoreductase [Halovibrio salipaludis]PAU80539.1 ferredoxin--NADP(+) reductase [Halovibrio salipaludis]
MITSQQPSIPVRVTGIDQVTPSVKTFTLEHTEGIPLPCFSGGSHVVVTMKDAQGQVCHRNPYSLTSPPDDGRCYRISVRRDDAGRGGSLFMHERVGEGDFLDISAPVNLFPLNVLARRHVLIASGIGITPFLAQMHELRQRGVPYELHYQFRDDDGAPYRDAIAAREPTASFYESDQGEYLDPLAILRDQPLGTHVYVCGPAGLINDVSAAATKLGWPPRHVHSEAFTAPPVGEPFTVVCHRSEREIEVPGTASVLEALEGAGLEPACSCRGGACGECETRVLEGDIEHHDHFLSDDVKAANSRMMICVSRARTSRVVLDL